MVLDIAHNLRSGQMSSYADIASSLKCQIVRAQVNSEGSESHTAAAGGVSPAHKSRSTYGKQVRSAHCKSITAIMREIGNVVSYVRGLVVSSVVNALAR